MTPAQITAIRYVAKAITDTVKEAEPIGAPGGVIYAALSAQGCTLRQYEGIMGGLVRAGILTQDGDLYHVA
jgi:hypothetical protein